ncbi:MAG TPA: HAMP domain-containing protein [Leucothrix mucor]|uniref:histidine kinase n=1 Tax=Leucothrix mucor TaxID=45248 RepID=A0A7V2WUA5_LEUMU|nr:HAMP domain-containing protein [Leucothrix mucor]
MTKLFITLYLVVLSSFILFIVLIVSLDSIDQDKLPGMHKVGENLTKGTFMLLEKSIEGLSQSQIDAVIEQHRQAFGSFLGLFKIANLPLGNEAIKRLQQGEIVSSAVEDEALVKKTIKETGNMPIDMDLVYKKMPHSSRVWRINIDIDVDISVNESGIGIELVQGRYLEGMHYLLQQLLFNEPEEKWQQIINNLHPDYGLPLFLIKESILLDRLKGHKNIEKIRAQILKGELANISSDNAEAAFVQRVPNSDIILQIGPMQIPWMLRYSLLVVILLFVLSIALMLFLWAHPFWSSLIKIKQAADEFGAGNYSARIPYNKHAAIAKIAQAFNRMAEQTQRSIHSHKELTSAVSHELRTPVARMRFALEMLAEADNKKDQQRFINDINTDIDDLDLLLEELLTYARFDRQDSVVKRREEHLIPWISNSMEKLMPLANHKNLSYQIEDIDRHETAPIDARLMSRVLDNLVQNGLRYAHRQVKITLTKDNDAYLLTVEDDGKGIPKEERAHIFDAFSRLDRSRDRASGGFGLGLAIAKRIVAEHQGELSICDSALGGAQFEVRFSS